MRGTHPRIAGLFGLMWLVVGSSTFGLEGCGSDDGGPRPGAGTGGGTAAGTGGHITAGTGGSATAGTGGSTTAGTGGSTTAGTGGSTTAGTGGHIGTGGSSGGTGGSSGGTGGKTGTGGSPGNGGTGGQGGPATLTLTSTVLANGAAFPAANTCAGVNQSPPLSWTAGPTGTLSYAIVMIDTDITRYHWAIWNMPPTVMSLPAALPAGASITTPISALQAITGAGTPSYQGPCPNGNVHTYVLHVYALDVATLPGVATGVTAQAVFTAIQSHVLATGTLSGTSNAVRM